MQPALQKSEEAKLFTELLETQEKLKQDDDSIIFEAPPPAKSEPSIPLQDSAGRPKYIVTRLCWCHKDSPTDCRFHNQKEPGWSTCPQKPAFYDPDSKNSLKPKKLWGPNPDFGKPKERPAVEASA